MKTLLFFTMFCNMVVKLQELGIKGEKLKKANTGRGPKAGILLQSMLKFEVK
jgi:hypothetical protein